MQFQKISNTQSMEGLWKFQGVVGRYDVRLEFLGERVMGRFKLKILLWESMGIFWN